MDITFKCPACEQELEVDISGAGTNIECPACSSSITVPQPDPNAAPRSPRPPEPEPPKVEKHFVVPVHEKAPPQALIQKASRPLDIIAKEGDKKMRIRTIRHSECVEGGKDHFDERVSEFLERVGHANIVSVNTISYSHADAGGHPVGDYGVLIVFKG